MFEGINPEGHSPLGASAAYRFLVCPASVALGWGVDDEESEHASLGTAAHAVAAFCLRRGWDAWRMIGWSVVDDTALSPEGMKGRKFDSDACIVRVDKEMADAVQVYLNVVRKLPPGNLLIEKPVHAPGIHPLAWGRPDAIHLNGKTLRPIDYKHGAGIIVEVPHNPQCRQYAAMFLDSMDMWDDVETIEHAIVQPRGWHSDGPIRRWSESTKSLREWTFEVLKPGMERALVSRDTKSGEHCRFCPARGRDCPQLRKDMDQMRNIIEKFSGQQAAKMSNEQVARFLDLFEIAKIRQKAVLAEGMTRALAVPNSVPGWKIAAKKTNRDWKEGAEAALKEKFGGDAYTKPELKSPAKVDEMPEGEEMTARWAFKPEGGLTLVKGDDSRPAISRDSKTLFKPTTKRSK